MCDISEDNHWCDEIRLTQEISLWWYNVLLTQEQYFILFMFPAAGTMVMEDYS